MKRHSGEISRIEGFSDAVFALAVTLLVVSLEVPKTFDELVASLRGFGGFAAAFAILFVIWTEQNRFFRRYAMEDGVTLWLNALLLFTVVLFVYPLKFLFTWIFVNWTGGSGLVKLPNGETVAMLGKGQERELMLIYGAGYAAVFVIFLLMHRRAYVRRHELELTPYEIFRTRGSMWQMAVQISIGCFSCLLAYIGQSGLAGMAYMLIGPASPYRVSGERAANACSSPLPKIVPSEPSGFLCSCSGRLTFTAYNGSTTLGSWTISTRNKGTGDGSAHFSACERPKAT